MGKPGRSTAVYYAIPCLCVTLALLILAFQAGPETLMWSHHLQSLAASPLATSLTFSLASSTQGKPCPNDMGAHRSIQGSTNSSDRSATSATEMSAAVNLAQFNQKPEPRTTKASCPPTQKPVIKVKEPWYVKGRHWHPPPQFPRCTMDACFNYTRCENSEELMIYTYNKPALPVRYFQRINESKYNTNDPDRACLFFVFLDTPGLYRAPTHPNKLPFWQGGLNHVLITFGDKWNNKGPAPESIGYASAMASVLHETTYRPGFDVSIPLHAKTHFSKVQTTKPFNRKYFLTFRGLRYLEREGTLRSHTDFLRMHNGKDVVVVTSCRHPNHKMLRLKNATIDAECNEDEALMDSYSFGDLMNTTFGLTPAGRQSSSYRFAEMLSAGAVPVLIADNYVKPFDTLVQWHKCIVQFPSTEMHRILKSLRAMKREEVERRQKYCLEVYNRWFSSDGALLEASIAAQKTRFMGAFPAWPGRDTK
ncbi:hypothetical protein L7F22_060721 [Adiantum nelumboides]|nr:hypothetical protein [Adiantum nelumboides]